MSHDLPSRKWDFENDDKRLEAIKYVTNYHANADQWEGGWLRGYKTGKQRGWALPISTAAVIITAMICATIITLNFDKFDITFKTGG